MITTAQRRVLELIGVADLKDDQRDEHRVRSDVLDRLEAYKLIRYIHNNGVWRITKDGRCELAAHTPRRWVKL